MQDRVLHAVQSRSHFLYCPDGALLCGLLGAISDTFRVSSSSLFCWAESSSFCLARIKSCFSRYLRLPYSASSSNSSPCRLAMSNSIFRQAASKVILRLLRWLRDLAGSGRSKPNASSAFSCWGATSPYLFSQSNTWRSWMWGVLSSRCNAQSKT